MHSCKIPVFLYDTIRYNSVSDVKNELYFVTLTFCLYSRCFALQSNKPIFRKEIS